MPHYKKAFDIGTYTGNGGQYRVGIPTLRGVGSTGTQVANSLRFRASNSNYLTRTPASSGNRKTWTFSCWFKRGTLGGNVGLFSTYGSSSDTTAGGIVFGSSDQIYFMAWGTIWRRTTLGFKDISRWYHLVIAFDTTQATAANRVKMYIDGKQVDSFAASADPSLNTDYGFNTNNHHEFGAWIPTATSGYSYLDMYLAETYFLDGYAYDASYFGEFNSDGIWVPKAYTGSYGTNGFNLKFAPGAAGTDSSGNGNTWTLSGFNVTTSNTTYDLVTDSPTDYGTDTGTGAQVRGNYATMNSLFNLGSQASIINGGLTATKTTSSGYYNLMFSHFPMSSGKWYWEVTNGSTADISLGITTSITAERTAGNAGGSSSGYVYSNWTGQKRNNGTSSTYGATFTQNDVIGVALDMDNGTLVFYKNGVSQGTAFTGISGTAYAEIGDAGNTQTTGHLNFGQRAFAYTAPSGYKAVCTANITRPADSSLWFYGDIPDLIWFKNRSTSSSHVLADTVRGISLNSFSNLTQAEDGFPYVMEMSKFGMSLQGGTGVNGSTNNHVYWAWKAGSNTTTSSVTNTDGFDTSQVSVNRQAGFSIVTYTGTGSNMSVGHGLGAAPNLIIIKSRNNTQNWTVYHSSVGTAKYLTLNSAATPTSAADYFTGVTSTLWSMTGAATTMATNGTTYVAYCWTAIPGYSAFGSYTGNGSSDGPFIYTGFRPRFILYKASSGTAYNWGIYDTTRDTYNGVVNNIAPNATTADTNYGIYFDILSNGFKARTGGGNNNDSGSTYIYAAFAEVPFKFARAR